MRLGARRSRRPRSALRVCTPRLWSGAPANSRPRRTRWHRHDRQRGALVLVEGAAGIGKSHFVAELMRRAADSHPQPLIALSIAHSTAQRTPYSTLRALLWALLDLPAPDSLPAAELAARAAAATHALDPHGERLPLLREPLALPLPDSALTAHLDARLRQLALATFVIDLAAAAARRRPLLLVAEDAHWMDEASQQVLLALAQALALPADAEQTAGLPAALPAALLLAARPTPAGDSALLDGVRALDSTLILPLDELDAAGAEALAASRLGGPVDPLAAALIHARAQGNPFFAEELVDALRDIGRLEHDGTTWRLSTETVAALRAAGCLEGDDDSLRLRPSAPLADVELAVPGSVQGIVLARLDRLPPDARLALKVASVVGQTFALPLLEAIPVLEGIGASLGHSIQQALARDFVRVEGRQEQVYTFKHNITAKSPTARCWRSSSAISTGPSARRSRRAPPKPSTCWRTTSTAATRAAPSNAPAPSTTSAPPPTMPCLTTRMTPPSRSSHAHTNSTRARTSCSARRAPCTLWAAATTSAASSNRWPCAPTRPPLRRAAAWGEYAEAIGDYDRADAAFAEALAIARSAGDTIQQAQALTRQGMVAWRRGDYQAAEAHFESTLALLAAGPAGSLEPGDTPPEAADALYGLGLVYRQTGRYDAARAALARDLAAARALGRREREARTLTQMGHVESIERRHHPALEFYQQALAIRKAIGDRPGMGASLLAVAQAHEALGDYGGAEPLLVQALSIQRAVRNRFEEALALNELGILYWLVGDFPHALASLDAGLSLSRAIESEFGEAYVLCNLGQVLRDAGRIEEAIATLHQGLDLARAQEDANLEAIYCSDLALAEWMAGDLDAAGEHAAVRREPLRRTRPAGVADRRLCHAGPDRRPRGDLPAARAAVERALSILDSPTGAEADFPHRDYLHCAQVLRLLGDAAREHTCMAAAQALVRERAARITAPRDARRLPGERARQPRHPRLATHPHHRRSLASRAVKTKRPVARTLLAFALFCGRNWPRLLLQHQRQEAQAAGRRLGQHGVDPHPLAAGAGQQHAVGRPGRHRQFRRQFRPRRAVPEVDRLLAGLRQRRACRGDAGRVGEADAHDAFLHQRGRERIQPVGLPADPLVEGQRRRPRHCLPGNRLPRFQRQRLVAFKRGVAVRRIDQHPAIGARRAKGSAAAGARDPQSPRAASAAAQETPAQRAARAAAAPAVSEPP